MASIRTAIELQDNFTGILYQVIESVNLGLAAMEDLHQTMNSPVDASSIGAARDSINQATLAVRELDAAMQGVSLPDPGAMPAPSSAPVEIPVHWQMDSLEVFTNTGAERFESEVQSANNMLNVLNQTQSRIAQTAAQTDLFPAGAAAGMNDMQNRLQAIQSRLQLIESNPLNMGADAANAALETLRGRLDQAVLEQQNLNRAMDSLDVQAANEAYLRLSQTIGGAERYIRDNVDGQGRFNREIDAGANIADRLAQKIMGAVAAYATFQTAGKVVGLSDTMVSTTARLNMMNDGLQTTRELQDMIYMSAQRSRGSYQATADAVSKLGLMAGNAFGSSEEIIAFMEQVNKQFTIAGTEAAGIDAAMLQLTQAMGSGVLRGEEYNSIMDQAPNIIQSIAGYIEGNGDLLAGMAEAMDMKVEELAGNVQGNLKDIAGEGLISAELVKAAMFAAADETNAKFESMPMTFAQIWNSFQNAAERAFQPVLQRMNEIANSESFQKFVNGAVEALSMVAGIALEIFNLVAQIGGFVADNWSWIEPIIWGVVAALVVYNAVMGIGWLTTLKDIAVKGTHMMATGAQALATFAATVAQQGLNAAIAACPITWIIIAIIALVALFYAGVAAVNKFAGTSYSATGIICGLFAFAGAFIWNQIVMVVNYAIDCFCVLWNFIAAFANFFGNVFNDPVGAIARLFFDLADCVFGILESLASAIDTLFGSNLAGAVSGFRDSLGSWVDKTYGQGEEIMEKADPSKWRLERIDYKDAWDAGYGFGQGLGWGQEESKPEEDPSTYQYPDPGGYGGAGGTGGSGLGNIGSGVDNIASNTDKIADGMEITTEDLKYLRDMAEQKYVNRFTTASIKVDMTNNNSISSDMDLDGVADHLKTRLEEEMAAVAEGVHS